MSTQSTDKTEVKAEVRGTARPKRSLRLRIHGWLRWLHIYISMFSLLTILFFSLTGITLNHPDWTFGNAGTRRELTGVLPSGWEKNGKVDWFKVAEHLRATQNVRGRATDPRTDGDESSISFRAPGYSADCFIEHKDGSYSLAVDAQGLVGVMNDFHRGQNTGNAWAWLIDLSGILLTLVSITGLGLLWYLKKIRVAALLTVVGGAFIVLCLMKMAM